MNDIYLFFLKYARKCLNISVGKFFSGDLIFSFLSFYLKMMKKKGDGREKQDKAYQP